MKVAQIYVIALLENKTTTAQATETHNMPRITRESSGRPSRQAVVVNMAREKGNPAPVKYEIFPVRSSTFT